MFTSECGLTGKLPYSGYLSTLMASSNSEVRSTTESNNSKKRGQHGKYTPAQKAIIVKRAAEHGGCSQLVYPRPLYTGGNLVPHSFHFETRGLALRVREGCGLYLTRPRFFLPRITTNPSIHENLPPPPP